MLARINPAVGTVEPHPGGRSDNARIEHWTEHPRGGHFAALEVPDEVAADLRVFFAR